MSANNLIINVRKGRIKEKKKHIIKLNIDDRVYTFSLNSLEWILTLKSKNWTSLEKKWLNFQSLRVAFHSSEIYFKNF